MTAAVTLPGSRVLHPQFGQGVVVSPEASGYVRVFFEGGERQVSVGTLAPALGRSETVVASVEPGEARARRAWLHWQAHALPLLDGAAGLTSAKIDLLPHQVVLTHRVTTAAPRRFLVADEVGLGKTIETALILRELASRGELERALMVVPAGLVNNWHRELNEVFNLNFEVFGSEGDVTDRKTNAFAKHHRLIASVDTLKRKARIKKLEEAPPWDLVVFDEAHHLTAYRSGGKVKKTENFKLAEVLKDRSRDMILLSATPHQGDHFRFWMLVQLLDPTLFNSPDDMLEHRHRLNTVVVRRTKADACRPDGSPLFARRQVHTEAFVMDEDERAFYTALTEYLQDGFALAKRQGGKGVALGFVMTIFQKIAASSFAAVARTLRRRLIALTVHEGLAHDEGRDIDRRDDAFREARALIRAEHGLGEGRMADLEADRLMNEVKRRILKKLDEEGMSLLSEDAGDEAMSAAAEEGAAESVSLALPEERLRIKELLGKLPPGPETKVRKILGALGALWRQDPTERIVIFATYLGSVEMLGETIATTYPGQGVVVLKGGDHGSKAAAERRFKQADGPRVMICTAAGREGLNMQHARILINFDLPWNPMDMEQRIGRIHRYGQKHTAQVYNLVLSDTIEGRIFLLLDSKLTEIAKTLGKVDETGAVAEDLRSQILGQLSERLSYERLYSEALGDPELKRTRVELEAAMSNASEARAVVFELFQDLSGFSVDEYKPFSDAESGLGALDKFVKEAARDEGGRLEPAGEGLSKLLDPSGAVSAIFCHDRDRALADDGLALMGLDHPIVEGWMRVARESPPETLGVSVSVPGKSGVLSLWHVVATNEKGHRVSSVVALAVDPEGKRSPPLEKAADEIFHAEPAPPGLSREEARTVLTDVLEPMLLRDLSHRGVVREGQPYQAELVGWVEVSRK
ncbi:MAG: DEAD/DEAH box helicase family protein [Nitrospira sp.]|jgi:superfamily II DNA or RNA helicase|nr:DEAD/DEAH box helicase family protein [Nitrospira sp.]